MLHRLVLRLRAERDYWSFVVAREWTVAISLIGLVLGLASFLPTLATLAISFVALALSVVAFGNDYRNLKARWSAYDFYAMSNPFTPATAPKAPLGYGAAQFHFFSHGSAVTDDEIDEHIRSHRVGAAVVQDRYQLPGELYATAPYVLRTAARGSIAYNAGALSLLDDPAAIQVEYNLTGPR